MTPRLVHVATVPGFLPVSVTRERVVGVTSRGVEAWSPAAASPSLVARLPRTRWERACWRIGPLRRALRLGVACGHHLGGDQFLVADRRSILRVDLDGSVHVERTLSDGMRPLGFCRVSGVRGFADGVYYGDYGSNPQRRPLNLHSRDADGNWRTVFTFPAGSAEHVHAIVADPIRGCLWVFTGDYGDAAAIWQATDGFATVEPVARGTQTARACVGFAVAEGLLYATDSHLEPNSIRRLEPSNNGGWRSVELHPMVGSCIYGGTIAGQRVFTTAFEPGEPTGNRLRDLVALEPGPGIRGRACELVIGEPAAGFRTEARWEVDRLPKRLFQFSTIIVPDLDSDAAWLAVFAMGLRGRDGSTEIYRVVETA